MKQYRNPLTYEEMLVEAEYFANHYSEKQIRNNDEKQEIMGILEDLITEGKNYDLEIFPEFNERTKDIKKKLTTIILETEVKHPEWRLK